MKKSEILGLGLAAVTSLAAVNAYAAISCTATTSATAASTCSGSGAYTQDNVAFTGSVGVSISVTDNASDFSDCAYHLNGGKSFGMSTSQSTMTIRSATGKTATSGVGCSN